MNVLTQSLKKYQHHQKPWITREEVHHALINIKNDIKKVQSHLQKIEDDLLDPEYVTNKLVELDDRSRRNNIRINGIMETYEN